ncbi:MAG TPA: hypothetical protein VH012_08360 [Acidimicrobiales bacterium]|jgi:hypothetical protein|nr:hypothetical protein [Acidimicrobiales bacterium]
MAPAQRGSYFEELHLFLVVALIVVSIILGVIGWKLHPDSNGFQTVPQNVGVLVAGSGYGLVQTLTQSGDDGATLKVSTGGAGKGVVPLNDAIPYEVFGGPQGDGAAATGLGPPLKFDGTPLPSTQWSYVVLNPGAARPCADHAGYRYGTVSLPLGSPTKALVVPPVPKKDRSTVGGTVPPPGLCVHWGSASPFSISGPYLSARFPPLRGISSDIPFTQIPQAGDLGVGQVRRVLYLEDGNNTANFAIQTDPRPTVSSPTAWTWTIKDARQVIQVAATNASATQHENNQAFYSGVLFGVVGGALIALITELVVPLHPRRRRR